MKRLSLILCIFCLGCTSTMKISEDGKAMSIKHPFGRSVKGEIKTKDKEVYKLETSPSLKIPKFPDIEINQ